MLDVQAINRDQIKQQQGDQTARMSDDAEDPDTAANRLEAALERIARLSTSRPVVAPLDQPEPDLSIPEIADRLDSLIARLRAALGESGAA
jgi:hypothetical protein